MKKLILPFAVTTILLLGAPALQIVASPAMGLVNTVNAQQGFVEPTKPATDASDVVRIINRVAQFLFAAFLALAVIFLIVAAFFYLTASGNQAQLDKAKNILIYSIIAIVIALVAGGVTAFVGNILGTRPL